MLSFPTLATICCPRHRRHSLSPPSSTARCHQVIKPSLSATIVDLETTTIKLLQPPPPSLTKNMKTNTQRESNTLEQQKVKIKTQRREERGELSGGEVCARIEGSVGCNERLGGGGGGDELRGGVQRQVSETWSSSP
ncbi:hypothetical protein DY000_02028916 [Brassica cretica]|uniref:Uncharacterized protein n=1 Tax=Brassica cretica TaxID=69181 RepID=A0ABQ7DYW7_BRACR|nr:hypothetical protein DY000_02028916 [Brassica cretica]